MLKGDLATTPLAPLLLQLAEDSATGCLHILDAVEDEALVYFKNGDIYAVNVPGLRPQLGAKLISSGALSPEALADALEAQRTELQGWRLGELLVHLGYVDQPVVEAFVKEQVKDALWDLLRWSGGTWKFRRTERTREDVAPPMSVPELLAGMRERGLDWQEISAVVHGPNAVPMLSSNDNAKNETILDSDAWSMLCKIDGQRTLEELARDGGYTLFEAGQVLVRLVQAGLVDIEEDITVTGGAGAGSGGGVSAASAATEIESGDPVQDALTRIAQLVGEVSSSLTADTEISADEADEAVEPDAAVVTEPVAAASAPSLVDPSIVEQFAPVSFARDALSFADSIERVSAALNDVLGPAAEWDGSDLPTVGDGEAVGEAVVDTSFDGAAYVDDEDEDESLSRMRRIRAAAAAELAAAQFEANALRTDGKLRKIRSTLASFAGHGPDDEPGAEVVDLDAHRQEQEQAEIQRVEAERLEAERLEQERIEAERLEAERLEQERLEAERLEQERLEAERLEQERLEAERLEAERLEAERLEQERLEAERREQERLEAERLEQERLEQERLEAERLEQERIEAERLEAERLEQERLETERLEQERLEAERLEAERLEQERLEAERVEQERLEAERLEQERLEAERLEQERIEAERIEAERLEQERLEAERLEQERLEQERLEAERLEAQRAEQIRLEEEQRLAAELAAHEAEQSSMRAASLLLSELSQTPIAEPVEEPADEATAGAGEQLDASHEPVSEQPEPAIVGAPVLMDAADMTDTAALLRELSSLGGDEPPPPATPAPRPIPRPSQPEKKKKRGLFGR